jgi:hypothetical protein
MKILVTGGANFSSSGSDYQSLLAISSHFSATELNHQPRTASIESTNDDISTNSYLKHLSIFLKENL